MSDVRNFHGLHHINEIILRKGGVFPFIPPDTFRSRVFCYK